MRITLICSDYAENGGEVIFNNHKSLEEAFAKEEVHLADLKAAVEGYINKLLEPIRNNFEQPELKALAE